MGPFEMEFDLQPERNQGVITQLVTGVAERLVGCDCTQQVRPEVSRIAQTVSHWAVNR